MRNPRITRFFRHLFSGPGSARRVFPDAGMRRITEAIQASEQQHSGEICFVVESGLPLSALLQGKNARARALDLFSLMRIWDTEHQNGVLIYLLLADRDFEIVADRGIDRHVGREGMVEVGSWEALCQQMEAAFRQGQFEEGVLIGIRAVGHHLSVFFPRQAVDQNELPDTPTVL